MSNFSNLSINMLFWSAMFEIKLATQVIYKFVFWYMLFIPGGTKISCFFSGINSKNALMMALFWSENLHSESLTPKQGHPEGHLVRQLLRGTEKMCPRLRYYTTSAEVCMDCGHLQCRTWRNQLVCSPKPFNRNPERIHSRGKMRYEIQKTKTQKKKQQNNRSIGVWPGCRENYNWKTTCRLSDILAEEHHAPVVNYYRGPRYKELPADQLNLM